MATRDRLALTDDEHALQATLREFLTEKLPSAALRAAIESETGFSAELHQRLVQELGLGGLTVPEDYGGLGMSAAEAAVVHRELGRVLYPGPFLPGCLAAVGLLAAGDDAACRRWLPPLAAGTATGTIAFAGQDGSWTGTDALRADQTPAGWQLTGSSWFVPAGRAAQFCLVRAVGGGPAVFVAELGSGVLVTPMTALDLTRPVSVLTFSQTPVTLIASGAAAGRVVERVRADFELATAAEAAGGIDWCLDTAVHHARTREQFGQPIGSFQAIAHQCADMLAGLQDAWASARYAAAATAEGAGDARLATRVAVLRAGEAYRHAAETAIHILGGVGFTWEHDAHLYYRRAWSAQQLAGGAQSHRAAIASLAGLPDGRHD
jgi:alkylation response protein AidB-like acyl-CoA dehydrogenase